MNLRIILFYFSDISVFFMFYCNLSEPFISNNILYYLAIILKFFSLFKF